MATPVTNSPVQIAYETGSGGGATMGCDLLIVACDPRGLPMPLSDAERQVFSRLQNFTFHTYALKVKVPDQKPEFGIVLKPPTGLEEMDGRVYGFRNESAKQFTLAAANTMKENHVVVYRLWNKAPADTSAAQDEADLKAQLEALPWWPYGDNFKVVGKLATPYFDHFDVAGVEQGMPWNYLDLQGDNATIYVHGSTCFESVVTIWQYIQLLFDPKSGVKASRLPTNPDARVCVLGAGVSGILIAKYLSDRYTNITILERDPQQIESNANIYGKTVSLSFDEPKPETSPYSGPTICELGTCYLSPAYNGLVSTLKDWKCYTEGPRGFERGGGQTGDFRGIVVDGPPGTLTVIPFTQYVFDEARKHLPKGSSDEEVTDAIVATALLYADKQLETMGPSLPMPPQRPKSTTFLSQTYSDFLDTPTLGLHPLRVLHGILEYTYTIQGYGPLTTIPAFYGLVWINAALVFEDLLEEHQPLVTFWPQGWGGIWKRLSADMDIIYGASVTKIARSGVPAGARPTP